MNKEKFFEEFFEGNCLNAYEYLGAHVSGKKTVFVTYAPNAAGVNIFGDFNGWTEEPMERDDKGFWSFTSSEAKAGMLYKYVIYGAGGYRMEHADPYAFSAELRPGSASRISDGAYTFGDAEWMKNRKASVKKGSIPFIDRPLNVYEMHMGAFMRNKKDKENGWFNYRELAGPVIEHVKKSGFTHIELMPLMEYPFDGSWGYQVTGFFAPTCRYGKPEDLKYFIDECHKAGIGVIMDYVPVHFAVDDFALKNYDSTPLYEYYPAGYGSEWGTCLFDHSKGIVRSFLMSCASYWIKEYHFDGLRTDAVSCPIHNGGNKDKGENGAGMYFTRTLNTALKKAYPDVVLFAEDSSSWQGGVTKAVEEGGLGFDYKWDMGWMYDSLYFMGLKPEERGAQYHKMTFSMWYFYTERFILSLSHDEVVGGKGTILEKLPGTEEEKFAQLRAYYVYMLMHPGKKLQFMGNEVGEATEWNEGREVEFSLLKKPLNKGLYAMLTALNALYLKEPAFSVSEYEPGQFEWLFCEQDGRALYVMKRESKKGSFAAVLNFSANTEEIKFNIEKQKEEEQDKPEEKKKKKKKEESWKLILDSGDKKFGGSGAKGPETIKSEDGVMSLKAQPFSALIYEI